MIIDDEVEQKVRDTLHWAVKQKPHELDQAIRSFTDERTRLAALELLVQICRYVSVDAFGHIPSTEEIDALAFEVSETESWASLTKDEVATYLNTVVHGHLSGATLPSERFVTLSFTVAASLLSSQPKPDDEWWFDYLDKVEAAIETAN
ncbi:hypothetical protein [Micromonospora echinofusca]|uniref:Immunity protein Imm6 n=1 Tax=Micromonospora echinofusca TaxID=47858 RepID=A0ABS3VSE7_MICEH|nr:hypothetical protein [Micromonospora echinofusca]MBO4207455.1 hypothetical protein [Micromonospora echinofusca]